MPQDVKKLEDELKCIKQQNENHRAEANQSHAYYVEVTSRCSSEWTEITSLEEKPTLTDEEKVKLDGLKNRFTLVLCADFQMGKLIPYWGFSAQPGSTYYLQKLNHDIFGIVNHGSGLSTVYLFDESVGPKNTDHTISYLTDYIDHLPTWVQRIHIFLDNTSSTNKNCYMMSWAYEMVQHKRVDFLRISFLIAGHTKFSLDLLFSKIARTYNRTDVFTTEELKEVISSYAAVVIDKGEIVHDWRSPLTQKFSKLPGIRSLHDFIYVLHPITSKVVARTRRLCHTGLFQNSSGHVLRGRDTNDVAIPVSGDCSYATLGMTRPLTDSKTKHLEQMHRDFIDPDRRLSFLSIV